MATQEALTSFGTIMAPINGDSPASLIQEHDLTQALGGTLENSSYLTRGYLTAAPLPANNANTSMVQVRLAAVISYHWQARYFRLPCVLLPCFWFKWSTLWLFGCQHGVDLLLLSSALDHPTFCRMHLNNFLLAMQVGTPGGSYTYGLTPKAAALQAAAMVPAMAPAPMATPFTASAGRKL